MADRIDNSPPAFPCLPPLGPDATSATGYPYVSAGMTLRDFFAAKAMPACFGAFMSGVQEYGFAENWRDGVAREAYKMADAMLTERSKP